MAINENELRQGVGKDIQEAEATSIKSAKGRGVKVTQGEAGIRARGFRFKGQILGRAEMKQSQRLLNLIIDDLEENQQFLSDDERKRFRGEIQRRFENFQIDMVRKGLNIQKQLEIQGIQDDESEQQRQIFGSLVAGATEAATRFASDKQLKEERDRREARRNSESAPGFVGPPSPRENRRF